MPSRLRSAACAKAARLHDRTRTNVQEGAGVGWRLMSRGAGRAAPGDPAHRPPARARGRRGGRRHAALGLADDGPAHGGLRARLRRAARLQARARGLQLHRRAAPRLSRRRRRSGRRGDRAVDDVRRHRQRRDLLRAARRSSPTSSARTTSASTPADVEARITPRTKAVSGVHFAGYPAASTCSRELCERARDRADRGRGARAERDARRPQARHFGLAGCFSLFSNKILSVGEGGWSRPTTTSRRARAAAALAGMTSGTWERHSRHDDELRRRGLGFNYRLDEPRSALALSRLARLEADIARRRELVRAYRRAARGARRRDRAVPRRGRRALELLRDADPGAPTPSAARRCARCCASATACRRACSTRRSTSSRPTASAYRALRLPHTELRRAARSRCRCTRT